MSEENAKDVEDEVNRLRKENKFLRSQVEALTGIKDKSYKQLHIESEGKLLIIVDGSVGLGQSRESFGHE
jgi:hypothetical protein